MVGRGRGRGRGWGRERTVWGGWIVLWCGYNSHGGRMALLECKLRPVPQNRLVERSGDIYVYVYVHRCFWKHLGDCRWKEELWAGHTRA